MVSRRCCREGSYASGYGARRTRAGAGSSAGPSTIAADSVVPSQLAAVCQRLGTTGHGITVPAATQIPAPWASVLAQRDTPRPADGPEVFAPLAGVLPDLHGARFALAGLSMAAGESHLHAVSSGMPRLAKWFASTTGGPVSPGGSGTTPGTGTWR